MRLLTTLGLALSGLAAPVWAVELTLRVPPDEELTEQLRAASLLVTAVEEAAAEEEEPTRRDIVAAAQADYQRLLAVLFEAGHFGPVISILLDGQEAAELASVGPTAPIQQVVVTVQAGPRFLFRRAEVGPLTRGTEVPEGFAPGQPAATEVLRTTVEAGVEAWRQRGHPKAELGDQIIVADHDQNRLDAELILVPGPRAVYGPIAVQGAEDVRASHIARIADLREGRRYDPEELSESASRLQRTGAFSSVAIIEADQIGPGNTLPLTIQVAERLPRRIGFGAEISTDEGLGTSAFWLHRNLTGYADSLRVEGEIEGVGGNSGGADFRLTFAYNRPATFNPETDLFVNGGLESLDQPNFTSNRAFIEGGGRRIVSDEFEYSYGIGYEVSDISDAFGDRNFSILSFPLDATYDRRDNPLNATDGYYIEAGLEPFVGFETAGVGAIFDADLRGYQAFGAEDGTVLAARLQIGSVVGPDIDEVPATDLFFSGGGGTVRGQEFQSLGFTLDSGEVVGGRSFLGLQTEVRQSVTENIGIVGFVDFGLVSPDSTFADSESHAGAGVGLRYNTGIGPIRVDLGVPIGGEDDTAAFQFYIGIGQAF